MAKGKNPELTEHEFADARFEDMKALLKTGAHPKTLSTPAENFLNGALKQRFRKIIRKSGQGAWVRDHVMVSLGARLIGHMAAGKQASGPISVTNLKEAGREVFDFIHIPDGDPDYGD